MGSIKMTKAPERYAHDIKIFTVTFDLNKGEDPIVKTCQEGESVSFPTTPTPPTGYTFKGWSLTNDELGEMLPGDSYTPHRSVTIYAIYEVPETKVIYYWLDSSVNTLRLATEARSSQYLSWSVDDAIPPWASAYGAAAPFDPSGILIEDPMSPRYCSYWFCNMPHLSTLTKFENLKMNLCESISNMFHYCSILQIKFDQFLNWKTPNLKNMNSAFARCKRTESINLAGLDLSKVETMENLCLACAELKSLVIQSETPSLKIAAGMTNNCPKLEVIDFALMTANNITSLSSAFRDCPSLKSVKITAWNTYKLANTNSMFNGSVALEHIYVGDGWTTDAITASTDMFKGCSLLPNFDPNKLDKTHAKIGEYLEKGD